MGVPNFSRVCITSQRFPKCHMTVMEWRNHAAMTTTVNAGVTSSDQKSRNVLISMGSCFCTHLEDGGMVLDLFS